MKHPLIYRLMTTARVIEAEGKEKTGKAPRIGRRSFVKGIASFGTGLATTALLSNTSRAESQPLTGLGPDEAAGSPKSGRVIASDAATVVETTAGKVRGYKRLGVVCFQGRSLRGIHRRSGPVHAARQAGALGWDSKCPRIREYLPYARQAGLYGRRYLSPLPELGPEGARQDCLRANLWTPEINASHRRPVMVFMHGGGYSHGCAHDLLAYNGESLARHHDVVVVNHNHRLNAFGYLNLAEVGGERFASSANVGLLDLVALLKWVRENVASFGGDPGNVTIFGQSGGGGKVINLMAMPAAQGLFHRAAVQSGPILKALSPDYSGRLAAAVMGELGLGKSRVDELQSVPVDRLMDAAWKAQAGLSAPRGSFFVNRLDETGWGPTVDGRILPSHPFEPNAPSISAGVPLLTGTTHHEIFVNGFQPYQRHLHDRRRVAPADEGGVRRQGRRHHRGIPARLSPRDAL